jgi:hypothetical protein
LLSLLAVPGWALLVVRGDITDLVAAAFVVANAGLIVLAVLQIRARRRPERREL